METCRHSVPVNISIKMSFLQNSWQIAGNFPQTINLRWNLLA